MRDDDQLARMRLERELAEVEAELVAAGLADRPRFDRAWARRREVREELERYEFLRRQEAGPS
jgi:hypothetical protein